MNETNKQWISKENEKQKKITYDMCNWKRYQLKSIVKQWNRKENSVSQWNENIQWELK